MVSLFLFISITITRCSQRTNDIYFNNGRQPRIYEAENDRNYVISLGKLRSEFYKVNDNIDNLTSKYQKIQRTLSEGRKSIEDLNAQFSTDEYFNKVNCKPSEDMEKRITPLRQSIEDIHKFSTLNDSLLTDEYSKEDDLKPYENIKKTVSPLRKSMDNIPHYREDEYFHGVVYRKTKTPFFQNRSKKSNSLFKLKNNAINFNKDINEEYDIINKKQLSDEKIILICNNSSNSIEDINIHESNIHEYVKVEDIKMNLEEVSKENIEDILFQLDEKNIKGETMNQDTNYLLTLIELIENLNNEYDITDQIKKILAKLSPQEDTTIYEDNTQMSEDLIIRYKNILEEKFYINMSSIDFKYFTYHKCFEILLGELQDNCFILKAFRKSLTYLNYPCETLDDILNSFKVLRKKLSNINFKFMRSGYKIFKRNRPSSKCYKKSTCKSIITIVENIEHILNEENNELKQIKLIIHLNQYNPQFNGWLTDEIREKNELILQKIQNKKRKYKKYTMFDLKLFVENDTINKWIDKKYMAGILNPTGITEYDIDRVLNILWENGINDIYKGDICRIISECDKLLPECINRNDIDLFLGDGNQILETEYLTTERAMVHNDTKYFKKYFKQMDINFILLTCNGDKDVKKIVISILKYKYYILSKLIHKWRFVSNSHILMATNNNIIKKYIKKVESMDTNNLEDLENIIEQYNITDIYLNIGNNLITSNKTFNNNSKTCKIHKSFNVDNLKSEKDVIRQSGVLEIVQLYLDYDQVEKYTQFLSISQLNTCYGCEIIKNTKVGQNCYIYKSFIFQLLNSFNKDKRCKLNIIHSHIPNILNALSEMKITFIDDEIHYIISNIDKIDVTNIPYIPRSILRDFSVKNELLHLINYLLFKKIKQNNYNVQEWKYISYLKDILFIDNEISKILNLMEKYKVKQTVEDESGTSLNADKYLFIQKISYPNTSRCSDCLIF